MPNRWIVRLDGVDGEPPRYHSGCEPFQVSDWRLAQVFTSWDDAVFAKSKWDHPTSVVSVDDLEAGRVR